MAEIETMGYRRWCVVCSTTAVIILLVFVYWVYVISFQCYFSFLVYCIDTRVDHFSSADPPSFIKTYVSRIVKDVTNIHMWRVAGW